MKQTIEVGHYAFRFDSDKMQDNAINTEVLENGVVIYTKFTPLPEVKGFLDFCDKYVFRPTTDFERENAQRSMKDLEAEVTRSLNL